MKTIGTMIAVAALVVGTWAQTKTGERVQAATTVLDEIMAAPDKGIPAEVFGSAKCVAVVPSMKKAGFMVGANYGKGIAVCHTDSGWSPPAPFTIEGGSFGLQIGGQAVDLVMLVMNDQGMNNLLSSKVKLGADMSAAAGPVGRQAEASTDWKLKAQVLTYSRAKGAFAGVSLNGAAIKQDKDATKELYGKAVPFRTILTGGVPAPAETQPFIAAVQKYTTGSQPGSSPSAETSTGTASTPGAGTQPGSTLPQSSQSGAAVASSADVQAQIAAKLSTEPGLTASNVVVNVTDDAVQLSGSVPTQNDKDTVRKIAASYAGTRRIVDDNLVVK